MNVRVGDPLPPWEMPSVSAQRMKLYAALARDPSPIHLTGERPINQGPTNLGYVCNLLAAWAGPAALRELTARFTGPVLAGDAVVAEGVVTEVFDAAGERRARCDVWLRRGEDRTVVATAVVALEDA